MRILIVTAGSRGDVAPYTGLGVRLRAAGHDVALATQCAFANLVADAGLDFRPLPGDLADLWLAACRRHRPPGTGLRGAAEFLRLGRRFVGEFADGVAAAVSAGADAVLLSSTTAPLGYSVAERHHVPSMGVFLQPVHPTGDFPPMLIGVHSLGRWGNRTAGRLGRAVAHQVYEPASRRLRAQLGLPPATLADLDRRAAATRWPVLYGFSPTVLPRPADWRSGLDVVGYWWPAPTGQWRPQPHLLDFLATGPPPVFVGFGSMASGGDDRIPRLVGTALSRAGVRGVIQADPATDPDRWPTTDETITVGDVPHDWLFPRMAAVVHHAGGGTTAAGLRAGVPAIPVPMLADQPFWATRLTGLGVSPAAITLRQLSASRLAAAVRAAVSDPRFAVRARTLAARIAAEDGAGAVVSAVDRLVGRS